MNKVLYSEESNALMQRAEYERKILEREEQERAKWKVTGSREGLAQFRARLIARRATLVTSINYFLIITLLIIIWEIIREFLFPRRAEEVNSTQEEEKRGANKMHRCIKIRKLDLNHSFGHPLHRQAILIEEDKIVRRSEKLRITGMSPSLVCDEGGIQVQVQCNQVLTASARPIIVFEHRDEDGERSEPVQPNQWEMSLDGIILTMPKQYRETDLSSGKIIAYIKVEDNGEESEKRKINFKPHDRERCICTSEFNIFSPGTNEEVREVALIAQSVRKMPETRKRPQTMMNTKFQILDEDLKNFITDLSGSERVNTLYELVSMISNYCEKFNLWVEHNEECVMCDRTLTKALGFAGFSWPDLAQMLIDKSKIGPATEAQRIESSLRFPNPPITSIPGAKCNSRKTILDVEIDLGKEYIIPSGFRTIFAKIRLRLSQRE